MRDKEVKEGQAVPSGGDPASVSGLRASSTHRHVHVWPATLGCRPARAAWGMPTRLVPSLLDLLVHVEDRRQAGDKRTCTPLPPHVQ